MSSSNFPTAFTPHNSNSTKPPVSTNTKPRIQISVPPTVSSRGRKQITPASAVVAPRRPSPPADNHTASTTNEIKALAKVLTQQQQQQKAAASMEYPKPTSATTKKRSKKKRKPADWPTSSAESLPSLSTHLVQRMKDKNLDFPLNEECTALTLSPSGRLLIACFSDGTIRLFDLTGTFSAHAQDSIMDTNNAGVLEDNLFDVDESSDEESSNASSSSLSNPPRPDLSPFMNSTKKSGKRNRYVLSKDHQRFGAVVSQIHAKGVHTSLLMDVDVSEDNQYAFSGVLRGSMELVAVHLGAAEAYLEKQLAHKQNNEDQPDEKAVDLLDLVTVFRCSDAKLRGFGACTRLRNASPLEPPQYLLFTGKSIKNIHIWKFEPPLDPKLNNRDDDANWVQLFNCPTNGNTIKLLHFRYDPNGLLQGISKSDNQKLRVWDLSYEQHQGNPKNPFYSKRSVVQKFADQQQKKTLTTRPKRPHFCDVTHSESTLGVCGNFSVCFGESLMSIVSLDVPNVASELALPVGNGDAARSSRRKQRGELKSIVQVSGISGHVLMEVSDGTMLQYSHGENGQPSIEVASLNGIAPNPQQDVISRKLNVAQIGREGVVCAAVATYNNNNGRGNIVLRPLNEAALSSSNRQEGTKGFWGFLPHLRLTSKKKLTESSSDGRAQKTAANEAVCASPQQASKDIGKWTHPPSDFSVRVPTAAAAPYLDPTTGVKLFGSERKDRAGRTTPRPTLLNQQVVFEKSLPSQSASSQKRGLPPICTPAANPPVSAATPVPGKDTMKMTPKNVSVGDASSMLLTTEAISKAKKRKTTVPIATCTPAARSESVGLPLSVRTEILNKPSSSKQGPGTSKPPLSKPPPGEASTGRKSVTPPSSVVVKTKPKKPQASTSKVMDNHGASLPKQHKGKENTDVKSSKGPSLVRQSSLKTTEKPKVAKLPSEGKLKDPPPQENHHHNVASTLVALKQTQKQPAIIVAKTTRCENPGTTITRAPSPAVVPLPSSRTPSTPMDKPTKVQSPRSLISHLPATSAKKVSPDAKTATSSAPASVVEKKAEVSDPVATSVSCSPVPRKRAAQTDRQIAKAATPAGDAASAKKRRIANPGNQGSSKSPKAKSVKVKKAPMNQHKKYQFVDPDAFFAECSEQDDKLRLMERTHLPVSNVMERMNLQDRPPSAHSDTYLMAEQEFDRLKLEAHHRSTHELILKGVIGVAKNSIAEMKQASTFAAIDQAEEHWRDEFRAYYEMLQQSLFLQRTEASNLADQQSWEHRYSTERLIQPPVVETRFPFYSLFDEVLDCIDSVVKTARGY